jgi:hypothetical protein
MGRNHRGRMMKSMERAHVEMIEVHVGKNHDVDLGEVTNGQRGRGRTFRSECNRISIRGNRTGSVRIFCVPEPCRG